MYQFQGCVTQYLVVYIFGHGRIIIAVWLQDAMYSALCLIQPMVSEANSADAVT